MAPEANIVFTSLPAGFSNYPLWLIAPPVVTPNNKAITRQALLSHISSLQQQHCTCSAVTPMLLVFAWRHLPPIISMIISCFICTSALLAENPWIPLKEETCDNRGPTRSVQTRCRRGGGGGGHGVWGFVNHTTVFVATICWRTSNTVATQCKTVGHVAVPAGCLLFFDDLCSARLG